MNEIKNWIKKSDDAHQIVIEKQKKGAEHLWLNKKVKQSVSLWNGKNLDNVRLNGVGTLGYDKKMKSIQLLEDTNIENIHPRPSCSILLDLNERDCSEYNRVYLEVYPKSVGFVNFYFHFSFGNEGNRVVHAPSLIPNQWNTVIFEVNHVKRDKVKTLNITPFLFGTPPEALPELEILIRNIQLQQVDAEYEEGWNLQNRIAYSHVGYYKDKEKKAIVQHIQNPIFYVKTLDCTIAFEGRGKKIISFDEEFYILDFSALCDNGTYYLEVDGRKTEPFSISETPYTLSIWKSIQFLRTLRCGEEVEQVHSACHLNCRTMHPDGRSVPNFGGWHDAGDVSQFEICTAEMAQALLELSECYQKTDKKLAKRLLEEAKVGIQWLLRTRFGDGMRALAVSYKIWRNNVLQPKNEDVKISVAENGPFENFLACAAEITAAKCFWKEDRIFSDWCKRVAIEDFQFALDGYQQGIYTKRWGTNIDSQVAGVGAMACAKLYQLTKDEKYYMLADYFGNIILDCQQTEYPNWKKPLRGFFYENKEHTKILTYEHRGHEQSPIQGLVYLCEIFSTHPSYDKWKQGIERYAEYIRQTNNLCSPYGLMVAQVYELDKLNMERFTVPQGYGTKEEALENLKKQAKRGIYLDENVYLRRFPIAIQRRGFHATLLSKTKAISMIARFLKDSSLMQIAIDQLEWILGKNPFSTSSMYGEGYRYHPLYVAFSAQLEGALPVGFQTLQEHDMPYWPTINNAVYKEIWGHTTGKYLWVLADIEKENK